jgi:hypothetical protein
MGNTHGQFDFIGGSYETECDNSLVLFGFAGREVVISETPVWASIVSANLLTLARKQLA